METNPLIRKMVDRPTWGSKKGMMRHQAKAPLPGRLTQVPRLSILGPLCPQGLPLASPPTPWWRCTSGGHRTAPGRKGSEQAPGIPHGAKLPTPRQGSGAQRKGQQPEWDSRGSRDTESSCVSQDTWALEVAEWCPHPKFTFTWNLFGKRVLQASSG